MNILLDGFVCPSCFNTFDKTKGETINDAFTYDERHQELYCNNCYLVVKDPSITTLGQLEYLTNRNDFYMSTNRYKNKKVKNDEVIDAENDFVLSIREIGNKIWF